MSVITLVYTHRGRKSKNSCELTPARAAPYYNSDTRVYRLNPDGTKGELEEIIPNKV